MLVGGSLRWLVWRVHTVIMRVFAGGSGVMRGGKSDKSSRSGVLGVFEPDRLLAIVGEVELSGGSSSMVMVVV